MKPLTILLSLALTVTGLADGLPVDKDGNLRVPYSPITMSASQIEEMEAMNTVTLTKDQWARIRKVSPNTPKRLQGILPITWNDCLCAVRMEAVRLRDGRLAVFHQKQTSERLAGRVNRGTKLELQVDHRGQFYLEGILVRFATLLEAIRASKGVTEEQKADSWNAEAWVQVPPGMDPREAVFEDRIVTVYRELAAKGWNDGEVPEWLTKKREDG